MKVIDKYREFKRRCSDMIDNPLVYAAIDALSAVFPAKGRNEDAVRFSDREKAHAKDYGDPLEHVPALVDGHLDRNKILLGTPVFYYDENFTGEDIKRIADAGFDFIVTDARQKMWEKLFDDCEKYSVGVIAMDNYLPDGPQIMNMDLDSEVIFDSYRKHPAQVGNMGWDEPNAENFHYIAKYYSLYKKCLPEQFLFNNLFPGGATKKMRGTKTYKEYIDSFSAQVDSDYISMDIYPFHPLKVMNIVSMYICLNTYHCLGNACRRDGKDFWLYTQTQGKWYSHFYNLPTYEQVKWQIWASLCYGARSIIQVGYTPVWGSDAYAMVDKQGNVTEQYIYAKRINSEIIKLSPVLVHYRNLGVTQTKSEKTNPHFAAALLKQAANNREQGFDGIPQVRCIESESSALAGYFREENGSSHALMLVNCKNLYDSEASQYITVKFASTVNAAVYAHGEKISEVSTSALKIDIGSCDGVFITFR